MQHKHVYGFREKSEIYLQVKARVLKSRKRQSLASPIMGLLKLSPLGLASTQTRLISQQQHRPFIPLVFHRRGVGTYKKYCPSSKVHAIRLCGGTKATSFIKLSMDMIANMQNQSFCLGQACAVIACCRLKP